MGYAEQNLQPGEEIIYKAKLHWALFLQPIEIFILALLFFLLGSGSNGDPSFNFIQCLGGLFILGSILSAIGAIITFMTTEFALTNKRIIAKSGFIRRRSVELLLQKVESIGVDQPILGRLLDYGTITVTGTGGTKEPFGKIAEPLELRNRVNEQISGGG